MAVLMAGSGISSAATIAPLQHQQTRQQQKQLAKPRRQPSSSNNNNNLISPSKSLTTTTAKVSARRLVQGVAVVASTTATTTTRLITPNKSKTWRSSLNALNLNGAFNQPKPLHHHHHHQAREAAAAAPITHSNRQSQSIKLHRNRVLLERASLSGALIREPQIEKSQIISQINVVESSSAALQQKQASTTNHHKQLVSNKLVVSSRLTSSKTLAKQQASPAATNSRLRQGALFARRQYHMTPANATSLISLTSSHLTNTTTITAKRDYSLNSTTTKRSSLNNSNNHARPASALSHHHHHQRRSINSACEQQSSLLLQQQQQQKQQQSQVKTKKFHPLIKSSNNRTTSASKFSLASSTSSLSLAVVKRVKPNHPSQTAIISSPPSHSSSSTFTSSSSSSSCGSSRKSSSDSIGSNSCSRLPISSAINVGNNYHRRSSINLTTTANNHLQSERIIVEGYKSSPSQEESQNKKSCAACIPPPTNQQRLQGEPNRLLNTTRANSNAASGIGAGGKATAPTTTTVGSKNQYKQPKTNNNKQQFSNSKDLVTCQSKKFNINIDDYQLQLRNTLNILQQHENSIAAESLPFTVLNNNNHHQSSPSSNHCNTKNLEISKQQILLDSENTNSLIDDLKQTNKFSTNSHKEDRGGTSKVETTATTTSTTTNILMISDINRQKPLSNKMDSSSISSPPNTTNFKNPLCCLSHQSNHNNIITNNNNNNDNVQATKLSEIINSSERDSNTIQTENLPPTSLSTIDKQQQQWKDIDLQQIIDCKGNQEIDILEEDKMHSKHLDQVFDRSSETFSLDSRKTMDYQELDNAIDADDKTKTTTNCNCDRTSKSTTVTIQRSNSSSIAGSSNSLESCGADDRMIVGSPPLVTPQLRTDLISDFYELEARPFARGKFAQVKRAKCKLTNQCFAAKCVKKRRRLVDIRHEILLEIEALKLSYKTEHIVKLYEVYETPTEMILILEMANGDLQSVLDDQEFFDEKSVKKMIRQLLDGLQVLHDNDIAWLDVKPQNILLTKNGDIKLCDFGLSRRITKDEIREICGTPDYVAPEILRYDPIGLAVDSWGVGVLTYVLLSGYSPFGGENKQQTFCNITQAPLEFPSEFDNISEAGIDFMQKLIVKEPSERLTTREARNHLFIKE